MKIYEITFSPTGGTKKVADVLARKLNADIVAVDLLDSRSDFSDVTPCKDDIALIAAPAFGGRMPSIAAQRLAKIGGNGARAILVCVYGNRAFENTLKELQTCTENAGFTTLAAVAAIAEHSIAHQFATGRPDAQDEKQLGDFAEKIREKIAETGTEKPTIPGEVPEGKAANIGVVPAPTDDCIQCGICAEQCPVGAIDATNSAQVNGELCCSCMRCISVCPNDARKLADPILAGTDEMLKPVASDRKECELFI